MKQTASRTITVLTLSLWDAGLNGFGIGRQYYDYMKDVPKPGDLVLEHSSAYVRLRARAFDSGGLGYFVRTAVEPIEKAAEWAEENPGEPVPTEEVWYIEAFDTGEVLRWYNCRFIRVPTELVER